VKKIAGHILLFAILTVFITASGGLFFIVHTCHTRQISEIEFVKTAPGPCCHVREMPAEKERCGHACCAAAVKKVQIPAKGFNCCNDKPFFIKLFNQYLNPGSYHQQISQISLFNALGAIPGTSVVSQYVLQGSDFNKPPGEDPVRVSLISSSVLRL
jgi:hypothetical protein